MVTSLPDGLEQRRGRNHALPFRQTVKQEIGNLFGPDLGTEQAALHFASCQARPRPSLDLRHAKSVARYYQVAIQLVPVVNFPMKATPPLYHGFCFLGEINSRPANRSGNGVGLMISFPSRPRSDVHTAISGTPWTGDGRVECGFWSCVRKFRGGGADL